MKCKCPACGALMSLDVLLQHDSASEAIMAAFSFNRTFGKAIVGYLGLFRPQKSSLTAERLAKLLNELLPMVQSQRIERNGQVYEAPLECWIDSLNIVLEKRHTLTLPLKSHGYLLEIMSKWQGKSAVVVTQEEVKYTSKTSQALQKLAEFANE